MDAESPHDSSEIIAILDKERQSPVPEEINQHAYDDTVRGSPSERMVMENALGMLLKQRFVRGYWKTIDMQWVRMDYDKLIESVNLPKPDICFGFDALKYPQAVRDKLGWALKPADHRNGIGHLCIEGKKREAISQLPKRRHHLMELL